ncbi:hypothetical protein MVEN_00626600 [Mycena venus]|uniref:Actin-like ATPase domain-containing protein n=1 Tax=Mycena venus TaxID=2733690 RepID=A0A8H7D588_9AGAR|nr:hypothetical protein MVEN_00626600 [Mycena venus]
MLQRKPFSGSARKLVLGIDIGTTYAGMSYCLLEPNKVPEISPVTRFPAQDHVGGDSKVPSVVYYDRSGMVRACGAEALQESVVEQAVEERWEKAEWFKLHLRPSTGVSILPLSLPPLPRNKSALEVFADFLHYLFHCARSYITDSYPNGGALWIGLEGNMEFVLTHPNGWEGKQQAKMRKAAIMAGLIPDTPSGHQRIRFVTEGEASLHFCIMNGLATDPLRLGNGVVIIDAGGGTVDISAYRKLTTPKGETFEEIAPPQCLFVGSIFVSNRAGEYLRTKLRGSRYAGDVEHIRDCFDKTTKPRFRRTNEWQYIKFGRPGDNSEGLNITNGQLKLEGEIVATFFKPSLDAILYAVENLSALSPVSSVLLVGGFGASDWLYSELKSHLIFQRLDVSRPDSHVNKAVADGAVSFYLDHFVSVRVSKHTSGIEIITPYISTDTEHCARVKSALRDAAGELMLPKMFSAILHKNTRVSETREYRASYHLLRNDKSELWAVEIPIRCYQGQRQTPSWMDVESQQYRVLCTVYADTSKIAKTLQRKMGLNGAYYRLEIDVVLSFGLTELKAQIAWIENGVEKRGPAQLVYEQV